jgi:hypothetical protein
VRLVNDFSALEFGTPTAVTTLPGAEIMGSSDRRSDEQLSRRGNDHMKLASTFAILLATALTATVASAEWTPRDEIQAPRSQDVQAPRDRTDEVQAPRDRTDEMQAPRGDRLDEIQAPRG